MLQKFRPAPHGGLVQTDDGDCYKAADVDALLRQLQAFIEQQTNFTHTVLTASFPNLHAPATSAAASELVRAAGGFQNYVTGNLAVLQSILDQLSEGANGDARTA